MLPRIHKDRETDVWVDCHKAQTAYANAEVRGLITTTRKEELALSPGQIARLLGRNYKEDKTPKPFARVLRASLNTFAKLCDVQPESLAVPRDVALATSEPAVPSSLTAAAFNIVPTPRTGANFRPDPSSIDEEKGYLFQGHFEGEADIDCDIRGIYLYVERNDHQPLCAAPGKASYYNGYLPQMEGKFGFVTIDGERHYTDANDGFLRLFRFKAGQKIIFTIGRWCRAILLSKDDPRTGTLWYWIDDPTEVIAIEYSYKNVSYIERHSFGFEDGSKVFREKTLRKL